MKAAKIVIFGLLISLSTGLNAQHVQFHYDFRHSLDPDLNAKNFPSISFEYFKEIDSLGSFLLKIQSDLNGEKHNIGQTFIQLSQTSKFWKPKVYLSLNYSGGLGVAPPSYGYYLTNAFGVGVSHPFQWMDAWFSVNAQYRYTAFSAPSHDIQMTLYAGRGFFQYRLFISGSLVTWTENRNQGNEYTAHLNGKKFAFFGDPQIWLKVKGGFSVGSRINLLYHLLSDKNEINVYPTLGTKYQF